jgi:hypothetical protein
MPWWATWLFSIIAGGDDRGSVFTTEDAAVVVSSHPDIAVHRVPEAGHDVHNSYAGRDTYLKLFTSLLDE